MRFSQRIGLTPATKLAQRESMDDDLRASLWSLLSIFFWDTYRSPGRDLVDRNDYVYGSNFEPLVTSLWLHYFKRPTDTIDLYWGQCLPKLRQYFFEAKWFEV